MTKGKIFPQYANSHSVNKYFSTWVHVFVVNVPHTQPNQAHIHLSPVLFFK